MNKQTFWESEVYTLREQIQLIETERNNLERENAALRSKLELLCDTIDAHEIESHSCDRDGYIYCDCLRNNAKLARAALDTARKETGDDVIMRQHLTEGGTPT